MLPGQQQPITLLLQRWHSGDEAAAAELMPLVYNELRRLASSYLHRERDLSICRTELVHEIYMRLPEPPPAFEDRSHFFGIAARLMRQVLVDEARKRRRLRRQPDPANVPVALTGRGSPAPVDVLALDQALGRLQALDARKAQIVELRSFGGLTIEDIAATLQLSAATVKREWSVARLWLRRELDTAAKMGQSLPHDSGGMG